MTSYELGDVVLIDFPQTGFPQRKRRPGLVVLDIGDLDVVVAPVTTRLWSGSGDYQVVGWQAAGLLHESCVRLSKLTCLEKSDISRQLGRLSGNDLQALIKIAGALFPF